MLKKYRVTMKEGLAYVLAVVITVASCLIGIPVKAQTGDPLLEKIEGIVLDNNVLQGASIISSASMPVRADIVAALYDSSTGALEDVDIVTQAVLTRDGTLNHISYSSGKVIKIFVWDHINTMKPLVGTYVYPNLRPAFYVATNGSYLFRQYSNIQYKLDKLIYDIIVIKQETRIFLQAYKVSSNLSIPFF